MAKIDMLMQGFSLNTDQGSVAFCGVTLVQGTKNILVDVAHVGRRRLLFDRLAERGLTPADIDYVFLTHCHWDHILNLDVFPNAKVLVHPLERDYVKNPRANDWATPTYVSYILESHQIQEVSEGDQIDDGVSVLETPGHSRGSMALLVRSGDIPSIVSGDAIADGWSATSRLPKLVFWDMNQAKASIRKMLDTAQAFYPGHDRPFRVVDGGAQVAYLEPTNLRVFGWPDLGVGEGPPGMFYAAEPLRQPQDNSTPPD